MIEYRLMLVSDRLDEGLEYHEGSLVFGNPSNVIDPHMIDEVLTLKADGDELQYIMDHFLNVRKLNNATSMIWTGDEAWFILANLMLSEM